MSILACWSCRNVLDLHVDGRLTASAAAKVSAHLAGCAECRAEEKALRPALIPAKAVSVDLPPGLADAIFERWEAGEEAAPEAMPALRLAPAQAAALVYLAMLAGGSSTPGETSRGLPGRPGIEAPGLAEPGESFRTAP